MHNLRSLVVLSFTFLIFSSSTNGNNLLSAENRDNSFKLTVTYVQEYFINLAQRSTVTIEESLLEGIWDITIDNLTRIPLNGGSKAPGGVFAYKMEGSDFNSISNAPQAVYETDTQHQLVIGEDWYYYDFSTHTVNPLDHIYIIKTSDEHYYKLPIADAVFSLRTDGKLVIKIEKVNAPDNFNVRDAIGRVIVSKLVLSNSENTYFNFEQAQQVSVEDEATSMDWHLKSEFVTIYLNGSTSGSAACAAQMIQNTVFDSLLSALSQGLCI